MSGKMQGKIRQFTTELSKVLYIRISKDFGTSQILKRLSLEVYKSLKDLQDTDDSGLMMQALNQIEENLRQLINVLYQTVFNKRPPTNLLYFSGLQMVAGQGSQVDFECIGYRKILLLFIVISTICAFVKTKDTDYLKILEVLHKINITASPKDKVDKYGNAYLAKAATLLLLATPENDQEIKSQVFNLLNIVI